MFLYYKNLGLEDKNLPPSIKYCGGILWNVFIVRMVLNG